MDRNIKNGVCYFFACSVALRKESVDRNYNKSTLLHLHIVALRKESVDRNLSMGLDGRFKLWSLSARRAWIEMFLRFRFFEFAEVALRKESVDRNYIIKVTRNTPAAVALRKESVDRNNALLSRFGSNLVALRKESVDRNSCWLLA